LKCPICGTGMVTVKLKKAEIDACPKCEGIWLDRGELKTLTGVDQTKARKVVCPKCKTGMDTTMLKGVEIDACPKCKSVWLDNGELEKLAGDKKFKNFLENFSSAASKLVVNLPKKKKK